MTRRIDTPAEVLYIHNRTAEAMQLRAEDIVDVDSRSGYVFLQDKAAILDLRNIQEQMRNKRHDVNRPIVSVSPDQQTPTLLIADNDTDAEEIQDILGMQYDKNEAALEEQDEVINTDWVRVINGLPIGQKRADMVSEALMDRIEKHKKNPISDPGRDPMQYARDNGYINPQIAVPDNYEVTDGK